ncbi:MULTISPECIES: PEGA domain-containing protein [Sorangium]|uniref:PEGA domain-containing protein n=1 Tax=Sorangium TaxID=39643 RepID=UPI0013EB63F7|nr:MULTISPECIES: PEGA domain-containing protein [Sorangium]
MRSFYSRSLAGWILALGLLASGARAAPPAASGKAPQTAVSGDEAEARAHFETGVAHFDKQEYREALEAFRRSLWLKKNRNSMGYIASCLKQLGQYDEALEQYEEMRREYPSLPAKMEAIVAADMAELSGLVGTLTVAGDAPAGASLFVDARLRGKLPLEKPLRVSAGRRAVRVEKEGFAPLTMSVQVTAGKENVAELVAKSRKGRLVVSEKHNWVLHVELDGQEVGVTPWQGLVDLGEHQVRLHGFMGVEALAACDAPAMAAKEGAKVASSVETARVSLYEETRVVLGAEEQDTSLRVESTPEGATVRVDSKVVGKAPWEGRLPLGEHEIEVSASGFYSAKQAVQLERRKQRQLSVSLERQLDRKPPKIALDASASFLLAPTLGGDVARCSGGCSGSLVLGGAAFLGGAYEFGSGIGFGVELGALFATQQIEERSAELLPVGYQVPLSGTASDALRLGGLLAGVTVGYHVEQRFPLLFRLGAGALIGQMRDEREGRFRTTAGEWFDTPPAATFSSAPYAYLAPEGRLGARVAEHFEVSASLKMLLLVALDQPRWDPTIEIPAASDGIGIYRPDSVMGGIVLMIAPGVSLRHDF